MLRILAVVGGVALSAWLLLSAARTLIFPRPERVWLTTTLFRTARSIAGVLSGRLRDPRQRNWVLGSFAPVVLLGLPLVWSLGLIIGFSGIFWGLTGGSYAAALELSGSSLTTLGFVQATTFATRAVAILEGLLGLAIVAVVISFLPTIYGAFSRREVAVGQLVVSAGVPPTAVEFTVRLHKIDRLHHVHGRWEEWERWFVELEETHTTFPALVYFRSARHDRSWLAAAETMLDSAALITSLELTRSTGQAQTLIRAGYLALRAIADFYDIPPEIDSRLHDELTVRREDFESLVDELERHGVHSTVNRETAWTAYAGWRINYDKALEGLRRTVIDVPSHWEMEDPYS